MFEIIWKRKKKKSSEDELSSVGDGILNEKGFGRNAILLHLSFDVEEGEGITVLNIGIHRLAICSETFVDTSTTGLCL